MNEFDPRLAGAASDKGPVRPVNQDAFMMPGSQSDLSLGALNVVADGVGGQQEGAVAASMAVQAAHNAFYRTRRTGTPVPDALKYAIEQANQVVYAEAQSRGVSRMGCTLVAAVSFQGQLTVAHVGDARAYLLRGGQLSRLTKDHSWVQEQVDKGVLTAAEAARHELRNVVTRVIGNQPFIEVELANPTPLIAGDVVLLCSDGLYDAVPEGQIKEVLKRRPPQTAAQGLVSAAVRAKASDNVTSLVVQFGRPVAGQGAVSNVGRLFGSPMGAAMLVLVLVIGVMAVLMAGRGGSDEPQPVVAVTQTATMAESASFLEPATPTPSATATIIPTATPLPVGQVGPTVAYLFDEESMGKLCDLNVLRSSQLSLDPNQDVLLLSTPESFQTLIGGVCQESDFIKVRGQGINEVEGWTLLTNLMGYE